MPHDVIMPKIGMYMEDIRLVEWLKDEGAEVAPGDLLFTLETDKITSDVEAEVAGYLHRVLGADSMVPIGGVVGAVAESREEYEALVAATPAPTDDFEPAQSELFLSYIRTSDEAFGEVPAPEAPADSVRRGEARTGSRPVSPRARALIAETGLAPDVVEAIPASGPGGRLTDKDVRAFLDAQPAAAPAEPRPTPGAPLVDVVVAERIPLRGRRRVIARRLLESLQTTAQLTLGPRGRGR